MEQCNCCKCNRECNKSVDNRCSCNKERRAYQQVRPAREYYQDVRPMRESYQEMRPMRDSYQEMRPMRDCYKEDRKCTKEVYSCPDTSNDEVGCLPLAMAYVPWQQWGDVYTGECGLAHGTIFPDLVKPWWVCCGQK